MNPIRTAGIAMAACLLFSVSTPLAQAGWQICNKTADELTVAIAYINNQGYISEGWWRLNACGECNTVLSSGETSDPYNVFYRAELAGGNDPVIDGDSYFCVSTGAFTMLGKGDCSDKRAFRHKEIDISGNYTTNITGRSASGRVCYD